MPGRTLNDGVPRGRANHYTTASLCDDMYRDDDVTIGKKTVVSSRYTIHLWDMNHEGVWENRAIYVYYTELVFELASFSIDFCHHLHMLVRTENRRLYKMVQVNKKIIPPY